MTNSNWWIVTDNGEAPFLPEDGIINLDSSRYAKLKNEAVEGDNILFYQGNTGKKINSINILGIYYRGMIKKIDNDYISISADILDPAITIGMIRDANKGLPTNMSISGKVKQITENVFIELYKIAKERFAVCDIQENAAHSNSHILYPRDDFSLPKASECDNNDNERIIRKAIVESLNKLAPENHGRHLIWPIYSPLNSNVTTIRTSEQELKQAFIASLEDSINTNKLKWYYSVETPTISKYKFSNQDIPKIDENGTSARIDLTIFSSHDFKKMSYSIESHIEFKQGATGATKDITKDLLKLSNEPYCAEINSVQIDKVSQYYGSQEQRASRTHYFIHIVDQIDIKTINNLTEKYFGSNSSNNNEIYNTISENLNKSNNNIIIYVLTLNDSLSETPKSIYRIDYRDALAHRNSPNNEIWKSIPTDTSI